MNLCVDCGQRLIADTFHTVDGVDYCPDCYNLKFAVCENCNEEFPIDETVLQDGDRYCEDCHNDLYATCHDCGDVCAVDDMTTSEDGDHYCECCYSNRFTHCEHCGDEVRRNSVYEFDGSDYCSDCFSDLFFTCDGCSDDFHTEDRFCTDDGQYCESCYENRQRVNDWEEGHFFPSDEFHEVGSNRAFGVELETATCPDYGTLQGETPFGCKHDGSIGGMEFVSPILSSDKGLESIRAFCKLARNFTVDSHCGYHAHFDLRDLTLAQRKAVAYAYALTAEVWSAMVPKTRRSNHYCNKIDWSPDDICAIKTDLDWRKFCGMYSRYTWLNVAAYNQHGTLEIRNHSATLSADKVCNWVKVHLRFIDAVSTMRLADIKSMFSGDVASQFRAVCVLWQSAELSDYYYNRASELGTELRQKEVA